jgi:hypothetical protein
MGGSVFSKATVCDNCEDLAVMEADVRDLLLYVDRLDPSFEDPVMVQMKGLKPNWEMLICSWRVEVRRRSGRYSISTKTGLCAGTRPLKGVTRNSARGVRGVNSYSNSIGTCSSNVQDE